MSQISLKEEEGRKDKEFCHWKKEIHLKKEGTETGGNRTLSKDISETAEKVWTLTERRTEGYSNE